MSDGDVAAASLVVRGQPRGFLGRRFSGSAELMQHLVALVAADEGVGQTTKIHALTESVSAITDDKVPRTGRRALYALKRLPAAPLMLGATVEQIAALALRLQVPARLLVGS